MTIATLYTRDVLALAASLEAKRLEKAEVSVTRKSRICGSTVTVDVAFEGDRIKAFGAEVEACALGQAAAAIAEKHAVGAGLDDIRTVRAALEALLAGSDAAFPGGWQDLAIFEKARQHKGRHSAILLPYLALEEAFGRRP